MLQPVQPKILGIVACNNASVHNSFPEVLLAYVPGLCKIPYKGPSKAVAAPSRVFYVFERIALRAEVPVFCEQQGPVLSLLDYYGIWPQFLCMACRAHK